MEWKRNGLRFINKTPHLFYCFSIFFFSISALFCTTSCFSSTPCPDSRCPSSAKADTTYFQKAMSMDEMMVRSKEGNEQTPAPSMSSARRYLGGLGSSPPRCLWKCGSCTPCKPVHVPVPPGTPVTAEYYPEAWRCKCGNKLYMP